MASAVRPLGSLSMARGCARIDAGPDTAKIGSADRVQDHARFTCSYWGTKNVSTRPGPISDIPTLSGWPVTDAETLRQRVHRRVEWPAIPTQVRHRPWETRVDYPSQHAL